MSGVWHIPPGQDGNSEALLFPFACAANVESAVVRCDLPQLGQASGAWLPRTSFSNLVPQSSQTYSKIGIVSYSEEEFNINSSLSCQTSAKSADRPARSRIKLAMTS